MYPNTPFYRHSEVYAGHNEADEGMAMVGAIRSEREVAAAGGKSFAGADALRHHFGVGRRQNPDLLGVGRQSGLLGSPMKHTVEGRADFDITLSGFPKGTLTKTSSPGMFREVRLNRGRAMPPANQEG
jgi:hypothetical protein